MPTDYPDPSTPPADRQPLHPSPRPSSLRESLLGRFSDPEDAAALRRVGTILEELLDLSEQFGPGTADNQFRPAVLAVVHDLLAAAMRSCPCGHRADPRRPCSCAPWELDRYWRPVEEIFLDLVHLHVEVPAVGLAELKSRYVETSQEVAGRVLYARGRQLERAPGVLNAHLRPSNLPECCQPDRNGRKLLDTAFERLGLSVRSVGIILRVARTLVPKFPSKRFPASHVFPEG